MRNAEFAILTPEVVKERLEDLILISSDIPHDDWNEKKYYADLPGKWSLSLLCLRGGAPAGFIIASDKGSGRAHIHKFAVGQSFRGKGVGGMMLQEFIKRLGGRFSRVSLKVYSDNSQAVKFYQGHSFSITGEHEGLYLMELDLTIM